MSDMEMAILEMIDGGGPQSEEDLTGEFRETVWRLVSEGLLDEADDADCLLHLTDKALPYVRADVKEPRDV